MSQPFFQLTDLGLTADPSALLQQWLSYMQTAYPGYTPSSSNLEYIMAIVFASWASDVANQASQGANALFAAYGQQVVGVAPLNGSSSTALVNVSAVDTSGYTLPQGTVFLLDNTYGFQSTQAGVIPAGSATVQVPVAAVTPGTSSNGAGLQSCVLNQQINWVSSTLLVAPAAGGVDPETPEAYLTRLTSAIQLMAPRPITASDYGAYVLDFQPAAGTDQQVVGRAVAIDGYDPLNAFGGYQPHSSNTGTYNNEREVTVCVTDSNGNALNSDTMTAIGALLESVREANFIVNVIPPQYSPVYVQCSVTRNTFYDVATVKSNIQVALQSLLSPATWGLPVNTSSGWINTPTIVQSIVENAIQTAPGVASIQTGSLGFGLTPNPVGSNDVTMPGPFPLPTTSNGATIPVTNFTVVN